MQQFLESTTTGQVRALQERGRQLVQALNLDLITDGEYDAELQKVRDQIAAAARGERRVSQGDRRRRESVPPSAGVH